MFRVASLLWARPEGCPVVFRVASLLWARPGWCPVVFRVASLLWARPGWCPVVPSFPCASARWSQGCQENSAESSVAELLELSVLRDM